VPHGGLMAATVGIWISIKAIGPQGLRARDPAS
jgi:hypothetical protein